MKVFRPLLILCFTALLLVIAVPAAARSNSPFVGNWRATDVFDGSNLSLWITQDGWSGGRLLHVRVSDDATLEWCGGPAKGEAIGIQQEEAILTLSGTWWCLDPSGSPVPFTAGTLTFNEVSDTITDQDGTVYYRGR